MYVPNLMNIPEVSDINAEPYFVTTLDQKEIDADIRALGDIGWTDEEDTGTAMDVESDAEETEATMVNG